MTSVSRSGRVRRLPSMYQGMEINSREIGPSLAHVPSFKTQKQQKEEEEAEAAARRENLPSPTPFRSPTPPIELKMTTTEEDEFGRFRIYHRRPESERANIPQPDHNDFADSGEVHQARTEDVASGLRMPVSIMSNLSRLIGLFLNATVVLVVQWFCAGSSLKSIADIQHLIDDVILDENFSAEDLRGVNIASEIKKLDTFESSLEGNGWKQGSVKIRVPCPKEKVNESEAEEFEITGLLYRDLTDIIKSACQDDNTIDSFHTTPFKEMWRPSDGSTPVRLYGEAYTSDEMIEEYKEVQNVPPDPDHPHTENIVLSIFAYSDATRCRVMRF